MNKQHIISRQLERLGSTVLLVDGEWTSVPYRAMIYSLWRKKSSNFESSYTQIGTDLSQYYHYIGPANHNITELGDNALLKLGDDYYEFKHRDKVMIDDEVIFYNGILRRLKGECFDEA